MIDKFSSTTIKMYRYVLYIIIVTAVFLVTAVAAVHVPVAPRTLLDAFYRPAASSLVSFALGRNAIGLVHAVVTIHDPVADGRRIVHVGQSRFATTRLFVCPILTVHCAVTTVVIQHHLSYSGKIYHRTTVNIIRDNLSIIFKSMAWNF